ncbi:MAG: hypothetical protein KatS3mg042_0462 [Rhodothermaceae bacterium]|nr:MAG: hypothetical protein KatS3mg042_0462 [Rhodothermaceae bacterium]
MPYQTFVDPTQRTGFVWLYGEVTSEDLIHTNVQLYNDPAWQPGFQELWHGLDIDTLDLDWDTLRDVVEMEEEARSVIGFGRCALVGWRDIDLAMAKAFQAMMASSGREVRLFRDLSEACAWLRLDHLPERPPPPTT